MKKDTSNKVRLGIFISLGILLLIAGIYFIGERQQLFRDTFRLSGVFKDVAGLQVGNNVRLSGVNVGTVDNITIISDSSVNVEIMIEENVRRFIKKDAIASIGSEGLMGNKALIINAGVGGKQQIENGDSMATSPPIDMDDILLSLKTTMENSSNITNYLSSITKNIESGKGTIGKLLMDESVANNFNSTIANLQEASSGFRLLMKEAKISFDKNIDSTFVSLKEGSEGFKILMEKAQSSWLLWGF
ncbi:MAG: MCE family protein [Bacteroidetes bacterium]|nr:MCE family protein [Bacteroidota bacterium]